jgi:hypothetical protein
MEHPSVVQPIRTVQDILHALGKAGPDPQTVLVAIEVLKKYTYTTGAELGVLTPYAEPEPDRPIPPATLDEFRRLIDAVKDRMDGDDDKDRLDRFRHAELCRTNAGDRMSTSGRVLTYKPSETEWALLAVDADRALNRLKDDLKRGQRPPPNSLTPPNLFYWHGARHELPPRLWAILDCLWGKERIEAQTLEDHVWGDEGEAVADGTVRSRLSELNGRLTEIGVPWQYHLRKGYVVKS